MSATTLDLTPLTGAGYDVTPAGACVLVTKPGMHPHYGASSRYVMLASLEEAEDMVAYVAECFTPSLLPGAPTPTRHRKDTVAEDATRPGELTR